MKGNYRQEREGERVREMKSEKVWNEVRKSLSKITYEIYNCILLCYIMLTHACLISGWYNNFIFKYIWIKIVTKENIINKEEYNTHVEQTNS